MSPLTRRSMLTAAAGAATLAQAAPLPSQPLGRVKPRASLSVSASPFSIGFELLDRQLFEPEKTYPLLAQLGVKWARTQTGWSRCERTKGVYDFTWLDNVVDSLRKIGIQPWFCFGFGNRLYTPEAEHETAVGFPPLNTAEAKEAWVRFTGKIAEHFRTRVQHWEIWNEPNISAFWRPLQASPESYMELLKMTVPQIRKRIPNAVIVGGALSGIVLEFVDQCLELGMAKYIDRLSCHPYRRVPEANYETDLRALRALLRKHRPDLTVWQGENGVRSANEIYGLTWTEQTQAKWLLRRMINDMRLELELTSYYHTVDCPNYFIWSKNAAEPDKRGHRGAWPMFAGILRSDYTPKPSYYAYQCMCALFDSETRRTDLAIGVALPAKRQSGPAEHVEVPGVCTGSWVRNGRPLYAYWLPTDFAEPFGPMPISLALWSGRSAPLAEPVLVDPIGGQIYAIPSAKQGANTWKMSVPLMDYPMIVTDRSVVS